MLTFIMRRLMLAVVTIWAISVLSFVIIQLPPGDYVTSYINELALAGGAASEETAQALREQYGLDQPVYVQYFKWIGQIAQGNLGYSMEWKRPVWDVIGERLGLTVALCLAALMLTWLFALPIGIYSAVNQYSFGDYLFTFLGFIGLAVPGFMLALVMLYAGWTLTGADLSGLFSPAFANAPWSAGKAWNLIKHLPLPAFILGLAGTAQLIRIMRANLLDELHRPYVVTARAKGLSEMRAVLKYPVRVALNPFASTLGFLLPEIVGRSIIVSVVLSLPTVGPLLLRSLISQDMFLAGSIVLLLGMLTVAGTLVSDLLLMWLDPRIRLEGKS